MEISVYVPSIEFTKHLKFQWKRQPTKIIRQAKILKDKHKYICYGENSVWINKVALGFAHHVRQGQLKSTSKPIYQTIEDYMDQNNCQYFTFEGNPQ
ncbi:unnamed protein product (macronuclear) [Paramecium tetraurelia]|uniref:Uncharacterized protein n=1 Tax=Paramecium tetraurelia TaxID=5888 RepID=A0BTB9_PARTE|nr:uncharacterized protein GSPATT00032018001 [Paramecium tetraurelia]CAK61786.1 unnamed protein product [Paramecium tetraurelia]|eukprot:XP_001429184.1 hypothetical protein (macronuclear) [Paramecium tetraurelia strain d4-2]